MPVSEDWAATLHSDFYWQSQSFARIFNDRPYDKIRGYSTTNLALILTSASGWQVMGYVKNVFDVTAITGDFLNTDDSGLTTNVFLTDPRLYGVRITKNCEARHGKQTQHQNDVMAPNAGQPGESLGCRRMYEKFVDSFSPPVRLQLGGPHLRAIDRGGD